MVKESQCHCFERQKKKKGTPLEQWFAVPNPQNKDKSLQEKWNGVGPSLKFQMLMVSEGTINELAEQLMNNAKMSKAYCYFISHPVWKRPRPPKKETILHSAPETFRLVELHGSKALILLLPLTFTNWNCQS